MAETEIWNVCTEQTFVTVKLFSKQIPVHVV